MRRCVIISYSVVGLNLLIIENIMDIDQNSSAEMEDVERSINMPIVFDRLYNLIVCKGCGIGISFHWIVRHLRENHGIKTQIEDIMRFLNMMKPSMMFSDV